MKFTRRATLTAALAALLSACATAPGTAAKSAESEHWSGRIGVTIDSEPPEQFAASFDLSGNTDEGELRLTNPLGNTLAILQWEPGLALLRQQNATTPYASLDALTQAVLGVSVPVPALFSWLRGKQAEAPGWTVDLSRERAGRISAQRLDPLPRAQLRVVLDRATS